MESCRREEEGDWQVAGPMPDAVERDFSCDPSATQGAEKSGRKSARCSAHVLLGSVQGRVLSLCAGKRTGGGEEEARSREVEEQAVQMVEEAIARQRHGEQAYVRGRVLRLFLTLTGMQVPEGALVAAEPPGLLAPARFAWCAQEQDRTDLR
eukprot:756600-Hanusia_phi.AAC.4